MSAAKLTAVTLTYDNGVVITYPVSELRRAHAQIRVEPPDPRRVLILNIEAVLDDDEVVR